MFLEASRDFNLNLSNCIMVGDSICDIEAGHRLDMDTALVLTGKGKETHKMLTKEVIPTYIVKDLSKIVQLLGENKVE